MASSSAAVNMGTATTNNNGEKKNDDTSSFSTDSYHKITEEDSDSSCPKFDLVCYLPTGWLNSTRKRSLILPKPCKILAEIRDALLLQFESLVEAQKKSDSSNRNEKAIVDRIKNLLVQLSQVFLEYNGVDIDETSILNILQYDTSSKIEFINLDTQNNKRVHQSQEVDDNIVSKISQEVLEKKKGSSIEENNNNNNTNSHHKRKNMSELDDIKSELYQCDLCKEVFDDFRALGGHKSSHGQKRTYQAAFGSNLVEESADRGREKISCYYYECNVCSKRFTSGQALGGHKTIHRKNSENVNVGVQESSAQVTLFSAQNSVSQLSLNPTQEEIRDNHEHEVL